MVAVMKVILSRKGFDSGYGGYASPILSNGKMISLPIPMEDSIKYSDLRIGESTYYDLMSSLKRKIRLNDGLWHDLEKETKCHLDPDIFENTIDRVPGWKPCFGQIDAAQSHLENQRVGENDLFIRIPRCLHRGAPLPFDFYSLDGLKKLKRLMANWNMTPMKETYM
jgi:hypothetical protein